MHAMDDIPECYRILDLESGASFEEIKRSYRELVKVWHPDRFRSDPKLRAKAEEKLKRINLAYERLSNEAQQAATGPMQERANAESNASQKAQRTNTTADAAASGPSPDTSERKIDLWTHMTKRALVVVAAILMLLLLPWILSSMLGKSRESAIQGRTPSPYAGLSFPTPRPRTIPAGDAESAVAQFKLGVKSANTPPASPEPPADESKSSSVGSTSTNYKNSELADTTATAKKSVYGPDEKLDLMKTMPTTATFKIAPVQAQLKINATAQSFLEAKTEASQQSQRLATAKYPDLKYEGTAFHTKFMELYDKAKSDGKGLLVDPNWPMKVADLAATALRAYDTLSFGDSKSVVIKKLRQSTRLKPYSTDSFKPQPDQIDGAYYLEVGEEPFRTYFTFDKDQLAEVAFCSLPLDPYAYQGRVQMGWKAIREIAVLRFGEPTTTWGFPSISKVENGTQFLSDKWELEGKEVTVGVSSGRYSYFSQLTITDKVRKDAIKKAAAGGF